MRSIAVLSMFVLVLGAGCKSRESQPEPSAKPDYDSAAVKLAVSQCNEALANARTEFAKVLAEHGIEAALRTNAAEAARLLPTSIGVIFTSARTPCDGAANIVETEARKVLPSTELNPSRHSVATSLQKLDSARKLYDALLAGAQTSQPPADLESRFERLKRAMETLPD